jgi:hypothetical protein
MVFPHSLCFLILFSLCIVFNSSAPRVSSPPFPGGFFSKTPNFPPKIPEINDFSLEIWLNILYRCAAQGIGGNSARAALKSLRDPLAAYSRRLALNQDWSGKPVRRLSNVPVMFAPASM